jgi:parallel beta-helix repeat protein
VSSARKTAPRLQRLRGIVALTLLRERAMRLSRLGGVCLVGVLPTLPAFAATVYVSSYGVDADGCGVKASPCRSISRALLAADPGDEVLVGPGYYGDLDRDGVLGETGEEPSHAADPVPCTCMIRVQEDVTVRSRDGAAATVIDGSAVEDAVQVEAPGAAFGVRSGGFLVTGDAVNGIVGIRLTAEAVGASAAGNVAIDNRVGIYSFADRALIEDNRAIGGERGVAATGNAAVLRGNSAYGSDAGYELFGVGHLFEDNVAIANDTGIYVPGEDNRIEGCSAIGNSRQGILVVSSGNSVAGCNVFGNGTLDGLTAAEVNCGVASSSGGELVAEQVFWGSATGPGDEPADRSCASGASTIVTAPFAAKPYRVRLRPIR